MFNVGQDIYKRGFPGIRGDGAGRGRMRTVYKWLRFAFVVFIGWTLYLGISGTDNTRRAVADGDWAVHRADIVDRNGDILAKNVMSGHIVLRNRDVTDKEAVANMIHRAMPYEYSLSRALELVDSSRRFIYLKKYASEYQRDMIKKARLRGLEVEPVQDRKYPKGRMFSHAVGFVSGDGRGLEGAERVYNKYLTENKDALQLSLDARVQAVFYDQLSIAMQTYRAKSAMGMLMNSRTGEIVAMVSLPD